MSSQNVWAAIVQELVAQGFGVIPDQNGGDPWLSYEAIAHLTKRTVATVKKMSSGLRRHVFAPFVKLSDLEAKFAQEAETTEKSKTRGKRAPSEK